MTKGLFVLAHGSKAKEADETLMEIMEMIKEREMKEFSLIGFGSLQFSKPTFEEGIEDLIQRGAKEIVIVPMFLFKGNHIQMDIPEELEALQKKHSDVTFVIGKHIGADRRIAEIIEERGKEAIGCTL
ncbi:cobalamin (vitamin B12) biosynthesis protein CbiX [Clostridium aceticum]|uniref:Cobalamin (Vitamin B12) biosynthesis protein CbiX n=1 Tax=Clostridium aceticum TaxID=84022 RepID=A0A0D8IAU1_9CLOT|nr:CbiX/SirB N-terminal domain-containing protein [Clostridium aceticum]AKL93564.1 cobalamin (vitamin B12) biosynthesis protein CbiX [Clostridium aceticum]KJF27157.1 hypothetical protein TZ02_08770 [Clostridium aceticum]